MNTISALTHGQMNELIKREVIQADLFDEKCVVEVSDPEKARERYCLCRNPVTRERKTRQRLLGLTEDGLREIAKYKRKATVEALGARVGKLLGKYKMAKFIEWNIVPDPESGKSSGHELKWHLKTEKMAKEEALDGCYIVNTDASAGVKR